MDKKYTQSTWMVNSLISRQPWVLSNYKSNKISMKHKSQQL